VGALFLSFALSLQFFFQSTLFLLFQAFLFRFLILFLVWFSRRRLLQTRLPSETEALLEELEAGPPREPTSRPWERDASWWKTSSSDGPG
jgi:hypothetical protein